MKKIFPLLIVLLISCFSGCFNSQKGSSEKEETESTPSTSQEEVKDNTSSGDPAQHEYRIRYLEQEGRVYKEFFEKLDGVTSVFSTFMEWVAVLVGIISVIIIGFQTLAFRRDEKMLKDMREGQQRSFALYEEGNKKLLEVIDKMQGSYEKSMKSQEESNNKLMDAVIRNTNRTTDFIVSYENIIKIKTTSEDLNKRFEELVGREEAMKKATREAQIKEIRELNGKAMRLVEAAFKANFNSTFFKNYESEMFKSFLIEATPAVSSAERDEEMEKNLNGDVYFLMGLDQFLSGQAKDAEIYFNKATNRLESYIKVKILPQNKEVLFPEKEKDCYQRHGGIEKWNKKLFSKCLFYRGVNEYRLGHFKSSTGHFDKALEYSPKEIDSHFFLYQSRYWSETFEDFPKAMEKMALLAKNIEDDEGRGEKDKKMILARLYKKIGDFYHPSDVDHRYTTQKDLTKSLEHYERAYNLIQEVNGNLQNIPHGYGQFVPMVYFALGKALENARKSKPKPPKTLFRETETLCEQVIPEIRNPETRYILYYTLAYVQLQLGRQKRKEAITSIDNAIAELEKFCTNPNYYGYSPVNNTMLHSEQLREELNIFRRKLFSHT